MPPEWLPQTFQPPQPVVFTRFSEVDLKAIEKVFAIVTYTTKDGAAHEFDALEFIADFRAPPPIPKFIDTSHAIDELPEYDAFEPAPDDF